MNKGRKVINREERREERRRREKRKNCGHNGGKYRSQ